MKETSVNKTPVFDGAHGKYIIWKRVSIVLMVIVLCGMAAFVFVLLKSDFLDKAERKLGIGDYSVSGREALAIKGWEKAIRNEQADIVFLGDSITYYGEWEKYFEDTSLYSIAVPGDSVEEILCKTDMVASLSPQKIFLMVGTNNISRGGYDKTIAEKYEKLIRELQDKTDATIYVQSILPVRKPSGGDNERIDKANEIIKSIAEKYACVYVNLHDAFSDENKELSLEYSADGCHINAAGYEKWVSIIHDLVYE